MSMNNERQTTMKTQTDLAALFPEAFKLLHSSRFRNVGEAFYDEQTGQTYPLKGVNMDDFSWEVVDWLLNWLNESVAHPEQALRAPLVVIEGPPMSGKSWLLQELVKMVGCQGIGFSHLQFPPRPPVYNAMAGCARAVWVFDNPEILGRTGARQRESWCAFSDFLTSTEYMVPPHMGQREGRVHVLRMVVVLAVNGHVELTEDLERRAVRIRLQPWSHAEA